MKILIIRNYPSYMDVEKNTYNIQEVGLAKALVRKGNVCDIVFWTNQDEKEVDIPLDDSGKVTVFYRHGKTALKNTVYTGCDELFAQYDVLQTAEYNQMQSWIFAKKYPEKHIIYHGPYYASFNKRYNLMCAVFDLFFLNRYRKLGTRFITKSKLAQEFLESKGIKNTNIKTIGVGIDTQMLSSGQTECSEPLYLAMRNDGNKKLLYIGRFEERRNIPFVFDVFSKILKRNTNVTLYMIGTGDKEYTDKCWNYADKLGIRENIIHQERMEQKYLSSVYTLADCFLLPTEYEIFGMVLLEAMYYGTPVFTTYNGGSSTLMTEDNGIVIENLDANEWSNRIVQVLTDEEKRKKIAENAHKKIAEKYTWDVLAGEFLDFYRLRLKEMLN